MTISTFQTNFRDRGQQSKFHVVHKIVHDPASAAGSRDYILILYFLRCRESQMIKLPDVKKIMIFAFNCAPPKGQTTVESIENLKPLTQLVFYMIDKVKRFKLSKEGKNKSEKNRQRVEEIFLKATHAQRQEQAQVKREERRRAEKEKILNEQDPEKQRRWEEKEHKRDMKRKTPKMKQLKVKAM